jgi:L-threonylcarbamoyladenylate synthase
MAGWVADVTPVVHKLISQFWPGALTIVMRKLPEFRSLALAKRDTVALRVPANDLVRDIVRGLGEPITGTSANRSGGRPPIAAAEVALQLGEMLPLVIDGGRTPGGMESTVIDVGGPEGPRILREGPVTREQLSKVLGKVIG